MKVLLISVVLTLSLTVANAQTYKIGDLTVNGGIGLGYTYDLYSGVSSWPTLIVGADKGVYEVENVGVISAGAILAFKHMSISEYNWSWNDLYIGGRGTMHVTSLKIDKVDLYGGLSLGLRMYSYPTFTYLGNGTNDHYTTLFYGLFAGGKYYFNDKLSAFGELGWDVAWLKLGICYKLN